MKSLRPLVFTLTWLAVQACSRPEPIVRTAPPSPSPPGILPDASVSSPVPSELATDAGAQDATDSTESSSPGLRALTAEEPIVPLSLPDGSDLLVSLPIGAREARPIMVATHGNYDTPEWTCATWRDIVGNRGFVLCPRGSRRGDSPSRSDPRYQYAGNGALEKEIKQGLAALRESFGDYASQGPMIYSGFSQGAIMGVPIVLRNPTMFDRLVLIEGAYESWNLPNVRKFAADGGKRILFACGQGMCLQAAKQSAARAEKAGIDTRVVYGKGEGHSYGGAVALELQDAWPWLIEGDDRWADNPTR